MNRPGFVSPALLSILFLLHNASSEQRVLVLHGLGRTTLSMRGITNYLKSNGFNARAWGYPGTSKAIPELAQMLKNEVEKIPKSDTVCFVTHSMGGIIARAYLALTGIDTSGTVIYRIVMLAPPNRGSPKADLFSSIGFSNWLLGPSLKMLRTAPDSYVNSLPPPNCQTGIIVGNKDFNVSIEAAHVEGEKDFLVVSCGHTFIMDKEMVRKNVAAFLKKGRFLKN